MIRLFSLIKTAKTYALDSSVTDEEFLNALLEPYVVAGRVKGRGGTEYHLDAARTSKILNGKADVPKALKKALPRYGILNATEKGMSDFLSDYFDMASYSDFVEDVFALFGSDGGVCEIPPDLLGEKDNPARFLSAVLIAAIKEGNLVSAGCEIWSMGTGSFAVEFGDLFSKGFGRRKKAKNIVVIPVNSGFDTELSWDFECSDCPVVSAATLHGQWLARMFRCGENSESLRDRIVENLSGRGVEPIGCEGLNFRYPVGTVALVENERAVFFLLAISDFDESNKATSSSELVRISVSRLLDVYDERGQGFDLYLPLLGTGLSRAGLTNGESYVLISETIGSSRHRIHGKVTLVIRPDDKKSIGFVE